MLGIGPTRPAMGSVRRALLAVCILHMLPRGAIASAVLRDRSDPSAVLKRVDDHYNRIRTLRCSFTEHFSGLGADRTERGVLLLERPGRMRWDYTAPAGKLFLLDGKYAWTYTPGDAQVQRIRSKQIDDLRSPLRFLLGKARLNRELSDVRVTARPDGFHIAGVPKGLEQHIEEISLNVLATGTIQAIQIRERDGSVTEFALTNVGEDVVLPQDAFHPHLPEGVPVVDALDPM